MKHIIVVLFAVFSFLVACNVSQDNKSFDDKPKLESDTIRISNEEIEYEVLIIDVGFSSWFNSYAKPRNYYSQSYLELRNRIWVLEWNRRAMLPSQYNPNLYEMTINYDSTTNYGYEVNYNGRDTAFAAYIPFVTHGIKTGVEILRARLNKTENQLIVRNASTDSRKLFNGKTSTIYSQPLDSMLRPMMHRSDNFYAEQTLLMASQAFLGFMGERAMIDTLLKTDLKGMPDKPVWVDGSGLSRYNLFSPADFVWLLNKLRSEFPIERVKAILPTGNAGTLTNYYTALNGKIFAKTGTLSGQVALSGYLYAKSGKLLLFSALVNNHNMEGPMVRRMVERYLMGVWEGN